MQPLNEVNILSSHQPNFLPYMGFFYKAFLSDAMALSTDVLFSKKGRHNWNTILSAGGPRKVTMPVHAHQNSRLCEVSLVYPTYNAAKIFKQLSQEYSNAPHRREGMELAGAIVDIAMSCGDSMAVFNSELIRYVCSRFGIRTSFFATDEIGISGQKDERILQICDKVRAKTYLSGDGAKVYHIPALFEEKGISLVYANYRPVRYKQNRGADFVENLSVIDYVFNEGFNLPEGWVKPWKK